MGKFYQKSPDQIQSDGQIIGEKTMLPNHRLRIISNTKPTLRDRKSVASDAGWVSDGLRWRNRIHMILKEKYKPHEAVNSIIFKIVNGFAYVF